MEFTSWLQPTEALLFSLVAKEERHDNHVKLSFINAIATARMHGIGIKTGV